MKNTPDYVLFTDDKEEPSTDTTGVAASDDRDVGGGATATRT